MTGTTFSAKDAIRVMPPIRIKPTKIAIAIPIYKVSKGIILLIVRLIEFH